MYIKRELEDKIRKYLAKPEILAVIGARQSGKTTLLKEIFKSLKGAVYIDFEDRDILKLFNNDIKSFYNLYAREAKYLFIDEFQYAKEGGQKLKYLYDTYKTKIIISGSSALDLTHQAVKYLVGRIFLFHLFPFNFSEFIAYRNSLLYKNIYLDIKKKIDEYLYNKRKSPPIVSKEVIKEVNKYYGEYAVFGGYPRVVLAKNTDEKITVLKNIYGTYFLREIRDILQLSSEEELQKLIKALSIQTGSMVVYKELGQIASLNYNNLIKHLNILEKTFVVKKILPFCKNKRIEIAKSPKVYFLDNGFRNVSINNFQKLEERIDRGNLNENFVAGQLLKKEYNINYWRTRSDAEVDFVTEAKGRSIAIEVKSTLNSNKTSRALMNFKEKYSPHKTIIVSENYFLFDRKKNNFFMPIFFI
ncbi:MAG: hypothetical protein B5M48_00750 [Candidatus Omnitrophica bacterium 4484_213]|nr:MAG: hypothetical protein B5M48_00750 [Candidatus Omnitrophica bacterium 4484_213]